MVTAVSLSDHRDTARRVGRWAAFASGGLGGIGLVFWFVMFTAPNGPFGWINDVLVMIQYALALPIALALYILFRRYKPILSLCALIVGIASMLAVVALQFMLVVGALTFERQVIPVSISLLAVGAWAVMTGYVERSSGLLPHGLRMSFLAVPYFCFPIWAFWLARALRSLPTSPESATTALSANSGHAVGDSGTL